MIRVLLVDDHASLREALALSIGFEPELEVVFQAGSLADVRRGAPTADVALVDLHLPDATGDDVIRELRTAQPRLPVLVLTSSDDRAAWGRAVAAGAAGVLPKEAPLQQIVDAVRGLAAGQPVADPTELLALVREAGRSQGEDAEARRVIATLTPREREVLQALADGLGGDKEIAERLSVSPETVHTHMTNVLRKLGAESRLQALVFGMRHGAVKVR